ncbi:aspartate/glutamate racemase family protein [Aliiglaciecola litoralis]|uniref:Aspartate/glutamate racemase family protein n=1 Tax=Aliiglaciecola litoralis TaxID=582857 RepID=A0ABP3X3D4_9ALTE
MRTIGLIGGMSWESTLSYYQLINQGIKRELGGLHSAKLVLHSVDFAEIEHLQHLQHWQKLAEILIDAAMKLEAAGADCVAICTNTMHKVAEQVENAISIPLLHIADATAKSLTPNQHFKVGLLGTQFTMEQDFYKARLTEKFGIEVLIPTLMQRQRVHDVIYQELCLGNIQQASKQAFIDVIHNLSERGAQAIILGCTEIALLVNQGDTEIKLYDTTAIHAEFIVQFAVSKLD